MMNRISTSAFTGILIAGLSLLGCTGPAPDPWNAAAEPRVVATFAPLHCFALNIVKDPSQVRGLLSTQGPHHADPPVSQAAMLAKANVLFANGLGIDDAIVRKMSEASGKQGPTVVKLAADLPPTLLLDGGACACCKDEEHEHEHHTHKDGHVWLGIDQGVALCEAMRDKLKAIDSANAAAYDDRTAAYVAKLRALKAEGLAMLKGKSERAVLPFHGSMTYFAKTFDLKLMDPIQDVAGQEPTSTRLDEIVAKCLKEKVRVIAVEPQYGAETSAKTLMAEMKRRGLNDVVIIVLDPLETATESEFNADWYITTMRKNLDTLAKTLK